MGWKHITVKKMSLLMGALFLLGFTIMAGVYFVSFLLGPPSLMNEENTIYYSNAGSIIGEESGVEKRYWVDLDEMSPQLIDATLAIEDKHFYEHNGFDLKRILGAALSDLESLSLKEGASTLTQQYARNLFLTHEKTWSRKLKEAFYTIRLEMFYSKDEILEGYLNTIYYGHGAYGAEAASRYFFDKSAEDLSLAEASMLAGIPKGPTYYSPLNDIDKAKSRQQETLELMEKNKKITEEELFLAGQEQMTFAEASEDEEDALAPYFQDTVLNEASDILDLEKEDIRSGGFHIYTTLDKKRQTQLRKKIRLTIKSDSDMEIGAMAMNPENGAIQALVGGRDYEKSPFNRAIQAKRMAGSTFKPFLYYAALRNGYTPSTQLMSEPTAFKLADGKVYQPSNYNGYYANKPITLAQALALSDNVYAVKTNLVLDDGQLIDTAKKFGISGELPAVPSLALGTASVSVRDMVTGYGMLANGGREIDAYTVEKITDRDEKVIFERDAQGGEQLLDPREAFILTDLMTGMFDHSLDGYMSVTGSSVADEITRNYAGKSGTTDGDSWMIGFSPNLVTGIWTGYDDNRPIEKAGETAYAKNIWAGFMEKAHEDIPLDGFPVPKGVTGIPIDPATGKRATPYCPVSRVMYYKTGNEPTAYCSEHFHEADDEQIPEPDDKQDEEKGIFQRIFEMFF